MVKYLESLLYELIKDSDRCVLVNGNKPTKSSLSEPDQAEMDEYLSNLRLVMGSMGHKFLEPVLNKEQKRSEMIYYLNKTNKSTYDARGVIVEDGFVVLKDSIISKTIAPSFEKHNYCKLRERLISEGAIVDRRFVKDYLFSSYSAAGAVVVGRSCNGQKEWKDSKKRSIADNLENN